MPDTTTRPWHCPRDETCPAPSHDTYSGYNYGCRSGAARIARSQYLLDRKAGVSRVVDPIGIIRRIEACHWSGHTGPTIGRALGVDHRLVNRVVRGRKAFMWATTAARWAPVLEELAMTPAGNRPFDRKIRSWARNKGYLPLLAWDDIDDPHEQPRAGEEAPASPVTAVIAEQILELATRRKPTWEIAAKLDLAKDDVEASLTARFTADLAAGLSGRRIAAKYSVSVGLVNRLTQAVRTAPVELDEHLFDAVLAGRRALAECSDAEQDHVVERLWREYTAQGYEKPGIEVAARLDADHQLIEKVRSRATTREARRGTS